MLDFAVCFFLRLACLRDHRHGYLLSWCFGVGDVGMCVMVALFTGMIDAIL